jgi:hypothetical protein
MRAGQAIQWTIYTVAILYILTLWTTTHNTVTHFDEIILALACYIGYIE